ncbi:MAG: ABC transporter permease subunit, partial [Bacteroidota bacterium]
PLIFTGLRITLSVAWMVLIAIELLAQSPGLGSFVWEEFQNGANDSNSKIIVAMFIIGIIGFLLDRIMLMIQNMISFNKNATA